MIIVHDATSEVVLGCVLMLKFVVWIMFYVQEKLRNNLPSFLFRLSRIGFHLPPAEDRKIGWRTDKFNEEINMERILSAIISEAAASGNSLLVTIKIAVLPIAKVFTMCFLGFLMASKYVNILPASGRKLLNGVCVLKFHLICTMNKLANWFPDA